MAKAATAENVAEKKREPQWRSAVQLIRGGIEAVKSKIGQHNEKIAEHWTTIVDGYKVNKIGAKIFARLDKLEPDERADAWRTIENLRKVSDWPEMRDMVDAMEEGGKEEKADEPTDEKVTAPAGEKPDRGKAVSATEARERAKRHLSAVPDAPKPAAEPKPGDDADLAGDE